MPSRRYGWALALLVGATGCSRACNAVNAKIDPCAACKEGQEYCGTLASGETGCVTLHKLGEACKESFECAGKDSKCIASKCMPRPKVGEACEPRQSPEQCIDSYCNAAKKCVPLGKVGDACEDDGHCAGENVLCKDARCARRPKLGERCSNPGECLDSFCGPTKTCVPAATVGQSCSADVHCNEGLHCIAVADGGPASCQARAAPGARCVIDTRKDSHIHDNCAQDHFCDETKRVCVPYLEGGAACAGSWQCRHGCSSGHCSQLGGGAGFSRPHPF